MKPSHFDQFLLAIDDIPLLGLFVAVHDITSFEVPVGVPGPNERAEKLVVCSRTLETIEQNDDHSRENVILTRRSPSGWRSSSL